MEIIGGLVLVTLVALVLAGSAVETNTFTCGWSGGGAAALTKSKDQTGDTIIQEKFVLAAGAVNTQKLIGFKYANIKGMLVTVGADGTDATSDPDGAVTLKTNSTGAPQDTLTFPSGGGEAFWTARSPLANHFTGDVTTTYWSNAGTKDTTVTIRIILNA